MTKKTIEINIENYENTRLGNYRSIEAVEDGKQVHTSTTLGYNMVRPINPVDFLQKAMEKLVIRSIEMGNEPLELTIKMSEEIKLSTGMVKHLSDKLQADPQVKSVTFK